MLAPIDRMLKSKDRSMQRLSLQSEVESELTQRWDVLDSTSSPISLVPDQGVTRFTEMNSNLVSSTGLKSDLEPSAWSQSLNHSPVGHSSLPSLCFAGEFPSILGVPMVKRLEAPLVI